MVLPDGFVLPPWQLLVPLLVVLVGILALLWTLDPPVTDRTVLAFVPWIFLGSTLHVLHRIDAYPTVIEPLFATPSVYLTTASVAGLTWAVATYASAAGLTASADRPLGIVGTGFFVAFAAVAVHMGTANGSLNPFWPAVAVVVTGALTVVAWVALDRWFPDVAAVTGFAGALVVFGHTLDGVSTAIGYDVLGASEGVPLSRVLLDAGEVLPLSALVGAGWLFVLVKVALALVVVGLFEEFVRESPRQARLVLAFVAGVGLGPGVHNVILFTIA